MNTVARMNLNFGYRAGDLRLSDMMGSSMGYVPPADPQGVPIATPEGSHRKHFKITNVLKDGVETPLHSDIPGQVVHLRSLLIARTSTRPILVELRDQMNGPARYSKIVEGIVDTILVGPGPDDHFPEDIAPHKEGTCWTVRVLCMDDPRQGTNDAREPGAIVHADAWVWSDN